MHRQKVISVKSKPKSWSVGIFVAAVLLVIGDSLWNAATSLPYLIGVVVVSFIVDFACTGSSSRKDVYID